MASTGEEDNTNSAGDKGEKIPEAKYRFKAQSHVDSMNGVRVIPTDMFLGAINTRTEQRWLMGKKLSTSKRIEEWKKNTVVSIYKENRLIRVVVTESLPFLCALCGEAYSHTSPLREHVENTHGYCQSLVDENRDRKKPVIIERGFEEDSKRGSPTKKRTVTVGSPGTVKEEQGDDVLDDDWVDDAEGSPQGMADISSDENSEERPQRQRTLTETSRTNSTTDDHNVDKGESILSEMAQTGQVTTADRKRKRDAEKGTSRKKGPPMLSKEVVKKSRNRKTAKRKRETLTIVSSTSGVKIAKNPPAEPKKGKAVWATPLCVVCGLRCSSKVFYREHLKEAHSIFPNWEVAVSALRQLREQTGVGQANKGPHGEGDGESTSLTGKVGEVIKCDLCEVCAFDEPTLQKHRRVHCGMPGVKCDICQEAIRLCEAGQLGEVKELVEQMQEVDRRQEDVDYMSDDNGAEIGSENAKNKKSKKHQHANVITTCYECGEKFCMRFHMSKHYGKAHDTLTCKDCNVSVPTMQALCQHSAKNHNPGIFRCQYCPRSFHDMSKYNYHNSGHMGVYRCHGCGWKFVEKPSLLLHLEKYADHPEHFNSGKAVENEFIMDKPYVYGGKQPNSERIDRKCVCGICKSSFATKGHLTKHLNSAHPGDEVLGMITGSCLVCDQCGRFFWSKTNLGAHKRTHKKKHACTFPGCSKMYHEEQRLKKHVESHSKSCDYPCDECPKIFKTSSSLSHHKALHSNRDFTCHVCQKRFTCRSSLTYHIEEIHQKEKNHACHLCEMRFSSRRQLLRHSNVHKQREKSFLCKKCPAAFTERRLLTQHHRIHNRPYPCSICSKSFNKEEHYQNHLYNIHGIGDTSRPKKRPPTDVSEQGTSDSSSSDDENTANEQITLEQTIVHPAVEGYALPDNPGEVVIVEYSHDEAANRAIEAIVSELHKEQAKLVE